LKSTSKLVGFGRVSIFELSAFSFVRGAGYALRSRTLKLIAEN
jgi:hypothetical protein